MTLKVHIHTPEATQGYGPDAPAGGASLVGPEGDARWRHGRQMFGKPAPQRGPGVGLLPPPPTDELGGLVDAYGAPVAPPGDRAERPIAPAWCRSFYQPRGLTMCGVEIMQDLDPSGPARTFPLGYGNPNRSLEDRLQYLARRHTALDLVKKGKAIQVGGYYLHLFRANEWESLLKKWCREMPSGGVRIEREELLQWLAIYRRPSLDQILALAPDAMQETWEDLDRLARDKWLDTSPVQLGLGRIETVALTANGWAQVRRAHPVAEASGWGPRRPLPQNREFHEQVVGDAVTYALHELKDFSARPFAVILDTALRRLYLGAPFIPDLRVDYTTEGGHPSHYLMEVEGGGSDYRGQHHRAKLASSGQFRVFGARHSAAGEGGAGVFIRR